MLFIFYLRYPESEIIYGDVYAGKDRYNGEIMAFYISLILGFPRVPIVVKRILDSTEIHKTANIGLKKTMYINCELYITYIFKNKLLYCKYIHKFSSSFIIVLEILR